MSAVRHRRLCSDYHDMIKCFKEHPFIKVKILDGDPPEKYLVTYHIKGIKLDEKQNIPVIINEHIVEIYLHSDYPRKPPKCSMRTPIFHPNISPSYICILDEEHWVLGLSLSSLIVTIGRLIQYQEYNAESFRNGTAANWAKRNKDILPIDNRCLTGPFSNFKIDEFYAKLPPVLPEDLDIVIL